MLDVFEEKINHQRVSQKSVFLREVFVYFFIYGLRANEHGSQFLTLAKMERNNQNDEIQTAEAPLDIIRIVFAISSMLDARSSGNLMLDLNTGKGKYSLYQHPINLLGTKNETSFTHV